VLRLTGAKMRYSHMPFLYPGGIAFASAPEDAHPVVWKLGLGKYIHSAGRLHTGLPEDIVECSPSMVDEGGGVHAVYFVAQLPTGYALHRLPVRGFVPIGPATPVSLADISGNIRAGTVNAFCRAADYAEAMTIAIHPHGHDVQYLPYDRIGLDSVARITFEYDRPWNLLISGGVAGASHTILYDAKEGRAFRIMVGDSGVYKGNVFNSRLAYAVKLPGAHEAREIRFAGPGEWRTEDVRPGAAPAMFVPLFNAEGNLPEAAPAAESAISSYRRQQRESLLASCRTGVYCAFCRGNHRLRKKLECLGIVDRDGNGCPRGLAWDVPPAALAAIRPGVAWTPSVWCERFMVGVTPAKCQQCIAIRNGGDPDAAARWLQRLAGLRRKMACASRVKTDARRIQECCGRPEKEIAVYHCTLRNVEAEPDDCWRCVDRTPPPLHESAGGAPC